MTFYINKWLTDSWECSIIKVITKTISQQQKMVIIWFQIQIGENTFVRRKNLQFSFLFPHNTGLSTFKLYQTYNKHSITLKTF